MPSLRDVDLVGEGVGTRGVGRSAPEEVGLEVSRRDWGEVSDAGEVAFDVGGAVAVCEESAMERGIW